MKRSFLLIGLMVWLLTQPADLAANPLWPAYLSEVCRDPGAQFIIEIQHNMGFDNLDGFSIETSSGVAYIDSGIDLEEFEYRALSVDDFFDPPVFLEDADHVWLRDREGGILGELSYGDASADVYTPGPGESICAHFYWDWIDEMLVLDYFYRDSSPTFGSANDTTNARGMIRGVVTDHFSGSPLDDVLVTCIESSAWAQTDSSGGYTICAMATPSTLVFTAPGYLETGSPQRGLRIEIGGTLVYDTELIPAEGIETPVSDGSSLPRNYFLGQNFPNPFNPRTEIEFGVPGFVEGEMRVTVCVYDIRGKLVNILLDSSRKAGSYRVFWDGRDEMGNEVGSGTYFYTIRAADYTSSRKMVVVR